MARITSGINATSENDFYIGDGADNNKAIYAYNTQVTPPGIRHNKYLEDWELSTDGVNWLSIVGGGSSKLIVVPATIEIDILKGSVTQSEEIPISIGACYINNSRWPANRTVTFRCILESSSEDGYYAAVADLYDSGGSLGSPAQVTGSQIDNTAVSYPTVSSVVEADLTSVFAGVVDGVFESRLWIENAADGYFVNCKSAQIIVESVSGDVLGSSDQNWRMVDNWTPAIVDGYTVAFVFTDEVKSFVDVNVPIRALDGYGNILETLGIDAVSGFENLTGLETAIAEPSGRLYINVESDGSDGYSVSFYKHIESDVLYFSELVGHTAVYTTTGLKEVISDNNSGLGGDIYVDDLGESSLVVEFYKWGLVESISSDELVLRYKGQPITDGVTALWIGNASRVLQISSFLGGEITYQTTALESVNGFKLYYSLPPSRIVNQTFTCTAISSDGMNVTHVIDQPESFGAGGYEDPFTDKVEVNTTNFLEMSPDLGVTQVYSFNRLTNGTRIEIVCEPINEGTVTNLSCALVVVLE